MFQRCSTFHADAQPGSMGLFGVALDVFPYKCVLRLIQDGEKFSPRLSEEQKEEGNERRNVSGDTLLHVLMLSASSTFGAGRTCILL